MGWALRRFSLVLAVCSALSVLPLTPTPRLPLTVLPTHPPSPVPQVLADLKSRVEALGEQLERERADHADEKKKLKVGG